MIDIETRMNPPSMGARRVIGFQPLFEPTDISDLQEDFVLGVLATHYYVGLPI